jgi:hypothetical protein
MSEVVHFFQHCASSSVGLATMLATRICWGERRDSKIRLTLCNEDLFAVSAIVGLGAVCAGGWLVDMPAGPELLDDQSRRRARPGSRLAGVVASDHYRSRVTHSGRHSLGELSEIRHQVSRQPPHRCVKIAAFGPTRSRVSVSRMSSRRCEGAGEATTGSNWFATTGEGAPSAPWIQPRKSAVRVHCAPAPRSDKPRGRTCRTAR